MNVPRLDLSSTKGDYPSKTNYFGSQSTLSVSITYIDTFLILEPEVIVYQTEYTICESCIIRILK
jgi:hypothetical protein